MIKITSLKITKDVNINMVLGTSVEVMIFVNKDKPNSIKITIKDPYDTVVVNNVDMIRLNTKVYNYIYQSLSTGQDGDYEVIVTVSDGTNSSVAQDTFTLEGQL
jgi:hypothetical protein